MCVLLVSLCVCCWSCVLCLCVAVVVILMTMCFYVVLVTLYVAVCFVSAVDVVVCLFVWRVVPLFCVLLFCLPRSKHDPSIPLSF